MKKKNLLLPCICIAAVFFFASCSKSGDDGPAGPAGPAGPVGPAGPAGPSGAAGTANVIYSAWITATFLPDTVHNGPDIDTLGYFAEIEAPKLDKEILDKGEIKVYVNAGEASDPFVLPLPYNDGLIFIDAAFFLNTIQLYSNTNLTGFPFRYILIPGGTPARSANSIDWNNYKAVQQYLGLKD